MQNAVKARFALRRLPHVRLCTLRQLVLAQSQALTTFIIGPRISMVKPLKHGGQGPRSESDMNALTCMDLAQTTRTPLVDILQRSYFKKGMRNI
ncbi:MAG: hypothetical protein A2Y14_01720 [Verrucomicrobia bacterium GWF2_51_19]|nr:MAG: hypothetical protein A2Y14_01720 [Verrucomicrobia bacterium GWF2_51_19]